MNDQNITPEDTHAQDIVEATLNRFDDMAVTMRSLELDVDEDLKGVSFGLTTFVSALENIDVYLTVAENNGGQLSENLQRRFAEAIIEIHVTMSRMDTTTWPMFDVDQLKATIREIGPSWAARMNHDVDMRVAAMTIKTTARFLDDFYAQLDETEKKSENVVRVTRTHVAMTLIAFSVLRERLVTIELDSMSLGDLA